MRKYTKIKIKRSSESGRYYIVLVMWWGEVIYTDLTFTTFDEAEKYLLKDISLIRKQPAVYRETDEIIACYGNEGELIK